MENNGKGTNIEYISGLFDRLSTLCSEQRRLSSIYIQETEKCKKQIGESLYDVQESVKTLCANEDTAFLAVNVMERYFKLYRQALVIPYEEIAAGNNDRINTIKALEEDFANNPAKEHWRRLSDEFRAIAGKLGLKINNDKLDDLTEISDIVANALTLGNRRGLRFDIMHIRKGEKSGQQPLFLKDICVFKSIAEAVHIYENLPEKAFVTFFGVRKTYKETDDVFYEWMHGYNPRKRNVLQYDKISEQEYEDTVDRRSQCLYVLVRDGKDIKVFVPPVDSSAYEDAFKGFTNYYGRRSTYAPLQIFFETPPKAAEGTSAIVPYARKDRWNVCEICDDEQKIWLPLFLYAVKKAFFEGPLPGELKDVILPEEVSVHIENGDNTVTSLVSCEKTSFDYKIPSPAELFENMCRDDFDGQHSSLGPFLDALEAAKALYKHVGITEKDAVGVPMYLHEGEASEDKIRKIFNTYVASAYFKAIWKKISPDWAEKVELSSRWYHSEINLNINEILERAVKGEFEGFVSVREHKKPIFNEDGTPKMRQTYGGASVQEMETTDISEAKRQRFRVWNGDRMTDRYSGYEVRCCFPNDLWGKHPAVVMDIHPETPEQAAKILKCKVEDLPETIRFWDAGSKIAYYASCKDSYGNYRYLDNNCHIKICFNKSEYKALLKRCGKSVSCAERK